MDDYRYEHCDCQHETASHDHRDDGSDQSEDSFRIIGAGESDKADPARDGKAAVGVDEKRKIFSEAAAAIRKRWLDSRRRAQTSSGLCKAERVMSLQSNFGGERMQVFRSKSLLDIDLLFAGATTIRTPGQKSGSDRYADRLPPQFA